MLAVAEVYDVTRAQLHEWLNDNWRGFEYEEAQADEDGACWLIAQVERNSEGSFVVAAWADMTAQTREAACKLADEYNDTELEEIAAGGFCGNLEYEVWHVLDAIQKTATYTITGEKLHDLESLAESLITLFKGEDGRLHARDMRSEGFLWAAQSLLDDVAEIAAGGAAK